MQAFDKKIWNDCIGYNAENWLHITKDENISSVSVVGAGGTIYSSGQLIPENEVLTIVVTPKSNYTIKTLTVNGNAFENGSTVTVYTAINIVAESIAEGILPIEENDEITSLKFDTDLTLSEVTDILAGLSYENAEVDENNETINLIVAVGTLQDNGVLKATRVTVEENTYAYVISVFPSNVGNIVYVWSSVADETSGITEGFQNLTNGEISVGFTVSAVNQGSTWNGIIAGK